jgi:DNA-binding IclR family transcriptional regulator
MSTTKLVPSLVRGALLLDVVSKSEKRMTVTQIAAELSIPKSTAHSICTTFVELNLLVKRSDQTYRMGPHIMRWANRFTLDSDVSIEFASIWDESSNLPGATITLSVLEGLEVVYLAARNAERSVGYNFRIGMRLPAAFTATGKCFLSHKTNYEIRHLYKEGFPSQLTDQSVCNIDELIAEIEIIRAQGYSVDNQQVNDGMLCCGAAVLNAQNQLIAGIAVSLSVEAFELFGQEAIAERMREMSKTISFRLGAEL